MVLLNKLAENNGKMCQKLMKFDRSCRLINVPHCRLIVFSLTDLTLIDIDIILINNKITVKAAYNYGKCKNFFTKFSRNSSASGGLRPLDHPPPELRPWTLLGTVSVKILRINRLTMTA